jgi:hypothetical protein
MIERYHTHTDFCATAAYQRWLAQWEPPADDINWLDCEDDLCRHHTPRHQMQERHGTRLPYHLLDSLEIGDQRCVDIGCGHNPHPGLWGVDPRNEVHRDELLTPEWYRDNWGQWPHAFTCNAMHFCDQHTIAQNIAKVRGILRPGGRAVITLNRARIAELTQDYDEHGLYEALCQTPGLRRMVWFDEPRDAGLDGNVWLWLAQ